MLLNAPDARTTKGLRDWAILAVLLGRRLHRSEVAALTVATRPAAGVLQRDLNNRILMLYSPLNSSGILYQMMDGNSGLRCWAPDFRSPPGGDYQAVQFNKGKGHYIFMSYIDFPDYTEAEKRYLWESEDPYSADPDDVEEQFELRLDPRSLDLVFARFWDELASKVGLPRLKRYNWEKYAFWYSWPALMGAMSELWATLDPSKPADYQADYEKLLLKWQRNYDLMSIRSWEARLERLQHPDPKAVVQGEQETLERRARQMESMAEAERRQETLQEEYAVVRKIAQLATRKDPVAIAKPVAKKGGRSAA